MNNFATDPFNTSPVIYSLFSPGELADTSRLYVVKMNWILTKRLNTNSQVPSAKSQLKVEIWNKRAFVQY